MHQSGRLQQGCCRSTFEKNGNRKSEFRSLKWPEIGSRKTEIGSIPPCAQIIPLDFKAFYVFQFQCSISPSFPMITQKLIYGGDETSIALLYCVTARCWQWTARQIKQLWKFEIFAMFHNFANYFVIFIIHFSFCALFSQTRLVH